MSSTGRCILFVYPEFSLHSYWGMQYVLPLVAKRAYMPPLGLLTIAALTPEEHEVRVLDLNCGPLDDETLSWADLVCLSAMIPQRDSLFEIAARCRSAGKTVVMGGPFPSACPDLCRPHCDVLFRNEAEDTWPLFLSELAEGRARAEYDCEEKPDVSLVPPPRFDLVDVDDYALVSVQYSRGCPYMCEFCDIIVMFGRKPRTKTPEQMTTELDALHATGYRGMVFFADDNFIGNKKEVKTLLPAIRTWNEEHDTPFVYSTEASVNLADDAHLLRSMVECNFLKVFLGLETPSLEGLKETRKLQNTRRSMLDSVREIQNAGMLPAGGFIIGFDSDREDIFDRQIEFIEKAAIPDAMVNLLIALPGTPLYDRLAAEGRLRGEGALGSMLDGWGETNVETRLPRRTLLEGFSRVLRSLYAPRSYFERCAELLRRQPRAGARTELRNLVRQGRHRLRVVRKSRRRSRRGGTGAARRLARFLREVPPDYLRHGLRFLLRSAFGRPSLWPQALACAVVGLHYHRFTFEEVVPTLEAQLATLRAEPEPDVQEEEPHRLRAVGEI